MSTSSDANPAPAQRVRALFRLLRDLNLTGERIALSAGRSVQIAGCSSLDEPADRRLLYRLRVDDRELVLEIEVEAGGEVCLRVGPAEGVASDERRFRLVGGDRGPITAPDLRARVDPDAAVAKDAVHFLRRVVRAAFDATSAA
ncbi:MAG: hypothetical protein R3F34_08940 [Planctomycetota bacterium]